MRERDGGWEIVAIGPTTSARMNSLEPAVIRHGARLIVGKGGMDSSVLSALHDCGAAYLSMTGGAAVLGARMVKAVRGVAWEDLGLAEAVWRAGRGGLRAADGDDGCARRRSVRPGPGARRGKY